MRTTLLLLAFIVSTFTIHGQTVKQILELKMPKTKDDNMAGTRGASIAWNPVQKKYYAVFAGNQGYPLAVFDEKGKRVSGDDVTAMIDTRGLWYDPSTKLITGNAYSDNGWFTYKLDTKGIPTDLDVLQEGMNQPDAQSVGVYNTAAKKILFQHGNFMYTYNSDGTPQDSLVISWGIKKKDGMQGGSSEDGEANEDYNYTSLIYTGIKGQEIGFLNIAKKQIELYDIQNGFLTKTVSLPETAKIESAFNFSYANGVYWLFDIENRKWVGYK